MATSNPRDVRLGLEIETGGEDEIKRLASAVRALGREGDPAAAEYARLANELDRLAKQAGAIQSLQALRADVEKLTAAQVATSAAAKSATEAFNEQTAAVNAARAAQAAARVDAAQAKTAYDDLKLSYQTLKNAGKDATETQAAFSTRLREARQALDEQNRALKSRRDALSEANREVRTAEAAETALRREYEQTTKAASGTVSALKAQSEALQLVERSATALGADVNDLAGAEARLLQATKAYVEQVGTTRRQVSQEQAEADRLAAIEALALAKAQQAGRAEALSQLAALKESEDFTRRYAASLATATTQAKAKAEADRQAAAAAAQLAEATQREAEAFRAAVEYTALMTAEVKRLEAEEERAAGAAQRVADAQEAVSKAFGQTGVRSLQAIREEMATVNASLATLRRQFDTGAIGADDLARASSSAQVRLATLRRELQTIPALPNVFERLNSSINDTISRFGSLTAAVATVGIVARPILDANIALETLRRTLTAVTGDSRVAEQQIAFLRATANQAGLSAGQLANSFSLFEASLIKSGQSVATTQELFRGVASAAGTLGISTDRVSNILLALGQVANKGKVSLEELQGQVGEALPGALKLAADSLGLTTAQLGDLLKNGKLLAEDFLPAFAKQLNDTFSTGAKPVEGLAQSFNRLKNAATLTAQGLADTSAYKALGATFDSLARNFDAVVSGATSLGKALVAFKAIDAAREFFGIKAAAEAAAAAKFKDVAATVEQTNATRAATVAIAAETEALVVNARARVASNAASASGVTALGALGTGFGKVVEGAQAATSRIGSFVAALGGPYGLALATAITFSEQLGNGLAFIAAKASGAVDTLKRNEDALRKMAEAEAAAGAAAQAREKVTTESFVKVQATFDRQLTAVENQIKVTDKLAAAKKQEGEASVKLAELSGDEAAARLAAAKAAGEVEVAVRANLSAKQAEVALLEQERAALLKAAGAQSTWSEARKQFFQDFDQNLEKKRAELELTKQQAVADGEASDKAFLAAQAYKDNSAELEKLKTAVASAQSNVDALTKAFKEGFATEQSVRDATRDLAVAQGLLKDAYNDASAAIVRRTAILKEQTAATGQTIDLDRARLTVDQRLADLTGTYSDKLQAQIKLKELDVAQSNNKIQAATKEAALLREEAALREQQLKQGDPLYAQKKREIDAIIAAADAKTREGLIERENLRGLETELGVINGTLYRGVAGFGALGDAAKKAAADLDVFTAAGSRARNAADFSVLGGNKYNKDGFAVDSNGNVIQATRQVNVPAGYVFDNAAFQRAQQSAALTGQPAPDPARYYKAPSPQTNTLGVAPIDFQAAIAAYRQAGIPIPSSGVPGFRSLLPPAVLAILDSGSAGAAPAPAVGSNAAPNSVGGGAKTINVVIGGRSTALRVASEADSAALESVLNQLAASARSAGLG